MQDLPNVLREEFTHQLGDFLSTGFQSEVTGVEQMELERLQISLVGLSTSGREDFIVLAPRNQHGRLVLTEIFLPLGIERRVAAVAEDQVKLDLVVAFAV